MLSNVGHPRSIWGIGMEVPGRQIIVDRPTGFFLRGLRLEITEEDLSTRVQSPHSSLRNLYPLSMEFISDQPVTEFRIIVVDQTNLSYKLLVPSIVCPRAA